MNKEEKIKIYKTALKQWGIEPQVRMVFEECSELMNALSKIYRKRATKEDVITELVDVVIMCEQMAVLFGQEEYEKEMEIKLERFKQKLEKTKGKIVNQNKNFNNMLEDGDNC